MPRKHNRAGHRPIDTMRQAKIDVRVGRFFLSQAVKFLDANFQTVDPARRLRQQAGRLVDDQAGAIFVQNF